MYTKRAKTEVLTSLNKVRVSLSYNEVHRARNDLARFTYFQSKNEGLPIPSLFIKDELTIDTFDNFYQGGDRSSLSGKFSNQDTIMTLFQVKPEQPPKSTSKTQIDLTKVTTKGKLPFQEKQPFLR